MRAVSALQFNPIKCVFLHDFPSTSDHLKTRVMKSYILSLATVFCLLFFTTRSNGQNISVEGLLDKALALSQKGDHTGAAAALTSSTSALESEAKSSTGSLKDKLLSQAGNLKSLIPLASAGKLQTGVLGKAVNAVKMLIGANRISSLLGKGESGLLGNAAGITSSLGLIKTGSSILGSGSKSTVSSLIGEATKTAGSLNKKGVEGKLAAAASSKSLGSIVKLVSSAL
jgi:hypothetical protein